MSQTETRRFRVNVKGVSEEGDNCYQGETTVQATSPEEARWLALDQLWDGRLDCIGCSPVTEVEEIETEDL